MDCNKLTYRQIIGTSYEYYVLEHIKNEFEMVWHWKNFPEKLMLECKLIRDYDKYCKYRNDIGADLVAFKENKYYFIQCKNFKDTIFTDTLAGFYFMLYEYNLNGLLYYNGKLSERLVDLSTGRIPFINLPFNNENIIVETEENVIISRNYQIEAYNKLKGLNKSILSLPCSMGKTYVSHLLGKDYDNIFILSPTRSLAQQTLEKFKEYLKFQYNYILISVDGKTKIDEINKILKNKNVISSTYDSCNIVNELIKKLKNNYIIIDEFHNLSEANINNNNNEIYKLINSVNINKLFISATPLAKFMNIDEQHTYSYNWIDAIKNKYICDFEIHLPSFNNDFISFINVIKNNYNEQETKLIKKAYNLVKAMLYNGDKKCICYLTTIEKANMFKNIINLISTIFNKKIEYEQIDCTTTKLKRIDIIKNFKNSNELFILLNIHVLDEGIDIPECDSVYVTQPNNNIINLVQRMCRANRIYKNKTKCNIYLWCAENKKKDILNYIYEKTTNDIKNKIKNIKSTNNIMDYITIVSNQIKYPEFDNAFNDIKKKNNINIITNMDNTTNTSNTSNTINTINPLISSSNIKKSKYICKSCDRDFKQKSNFITHTTNKKTPCISNNNTINNKLNDNLNDTLIDIKLNEEDDANKLDNDFINNKPNNKKLFPCKYCKKTFTRNNNLQRHLSNRCKSQIIFNESQMLKAKICLLENSQHRLKKEHESLKRKNIKLKESSIINNVNIQVMQFDSENIN